MEKVKYSDYVNTLIALVTHLGMTHYKSRTPAKIAKHLNLDVVDVKNVLESFTGLFRRSSTISSNGEYYYTLQLRYARRWLDQDNDEGEEDREPREPIGADYLSALLNFILKMVEQEHAGARQISANRITIVASVIAAVSASLSAIMILLK
jgi:hypothetical protein